jgi:hypothetical protein
MKKLVFGSLLAVLAAVAAFPPVMMALAEEDERVPPVTDPLVLKECGACHMAFQPAFLPARSWQKIMDGLKDHFGENAELDPALAKKISDYLSANAAGGFSHSMRSLGSSDAPIRISEMPWFVHKHDRKGRTSPPALLRAKAKSKADCAACHPDAAKGIYEDD